MTRDPGPPEVGSVKRKKPIPAISDQALRDLIELHVRKLCECRTSDYLDVQTKMAAHFTVPAGVKDLEGRVRDMLLALRGEGKVVLGARSGGIHDVTPVGDWALVQSNGSAPVAASPAGMAKMLAAVAAAPAAPTSPAPSPTPPVVDEDSDPAPGEISPATPNGAAMADPTSGGSDQVAAQPSHWPPILGALRGLIVLWLLENDGEVVDETGHATALFRARFELEDVTSAQNNVPNAMLRMELEGTIWRQRTKDPEEERTDKGKWERSKRIYKVVLKDNPYPGGLDDLAHKAREFLKLLTVAGRTDEPPETDDEPGGGGETEPGAHPDQAPTDDVLLARPDLLETLAAEHVHPLVVRLHRALWDARHESSIPSQGTWYAMVAAQVLRRAGFRDAEAKEARWYAECFGIASKGAAGEDTYWWNIPDQPPTPEAVRKVVVTQRKVYPGPRPPRRDITALVGGRPASRLSGVPATLGAPAVGALTVRSVGQPATDTPRLAPPREQPVPPAATAPVSPAPAAAAASPAVPDNRPAAQVVPSGLNATVKRLVDIIRDLEKQIESLKSEVTALTNSNDNKLRRIAAAESAQHKAEAKTAELGQTIKQREDKLAEANRTIQGLEARVSELEGLVADLQGETLLEVEEVLRRHSTD